MVVVVRVRGYLLSSRECMVETGHISHNGFLIRTSSVHNVYKVVGAGGGEIGVTMANAHTQTLAHDKNVFDYTAQRRREKQANTKTHGAGCRTLTTTTASAIQSFGEERQQRDKDSDNPEGGALLSASIAQETCWTVELQTRPGKSFKWLKREVQ